jgi:hypothetical protein
MTATKREMLTRSALALFAAILLTSLTTPLQADDVTFQFRTTIDASPVGGPADAPLVVTYTFDSNLQNGTGSFQPNEALGSYGPISVILQVADQCVTATGDFLVGNNWGDGTEDGYDVRFDGVNASGQLFGLNVGFFRFLIVDSQAAMFNSTAIPTSPDFAVLADFQQLELTLFDPATGGFGLGFSEYPGMPPEDKTPFSLALIGNPIDLINDLEDDVVSLGLSNSLKNGLLAKLNEALAALTDGNENNDHVAINKLQEFISQVSAKAGKQISTADATSLIEEAEDIIEILTLLLTGC